MNWLFEVAICLNGDIAIAAHDTLIHISELSTTQENLLVSMSPLRKALARYHARMDVLEALGVDNIPCQDNIIDMSQRSEALWRLSEIVTIFASKKMLDEEDVPTYFALILAIGMDRSTSFNLRLSIRRTLNALIRSYCGEFSEERGEMVRLSNFVFRSL